MISAAIEAHNVDVDPFWIEQAHLAFDWFLCRNDLGLSLYNTTTGGCHDGLQESRINENQGAESTLAFLMSLAEMESLETSLALGSSAGTVDLAAAPEKSTPTRLVHAG